MHETTYLHLEEIYKKAIMEGYYIISCKEYFLNQEEYKTKKVLINRIDIDLSLEKASPIITMMDELNISGTFFIRLHAREYNPFSFQNYHIIKKIQSCGFEVGLHSEIMDCKKIWGIPAEDCLFNDVMAFQSITGELLFGIASHGSRLTGANNLDFWKDHNPQDFGVLYEAYNPIFFNQLYCSIGLTGWKTYYLGEFIQEGDTCLCEYLGDNHRVIYFTLHPIKFYKRHCYE